MHLHSLCHVLVTRYESLWSFYLYSWFVDYSDLCCYFSLNYCFAAVVLIATNKVEYIKRVDHISRHGASPGPQKSGEKAGQNLQVIRVDSSNVTTAISVGGRIEYRPLSEVTLRKCQRLRPRVGRLTAFANRHIRTWHRS